MSEHRYGCVVVHRELHDLSHRNAHLAEIAFGYRPAVELLVLVVGEDEQHALVLFAADILIYDILAEVVEVDDLVAILVLVESI